MQNVSRVDILLCIYLKFDNQLVYGLPLLQYVTRKKGDTVDDSLIGGNASAEEPQEAGAEESTESGVDIILDNRLQPTFFGNKKEYLAYFKDYVKA